MSRKDNYQTLVTSASPHLKNDLTISQAMKDVIIALVPVTLVAVYFFKLYAVLIVGVCIGTALLTEVIMRKWMNKKPTLYDGSAALTGLLIALCFSATTSLFTAALATFIAVGVAKELMGGLGWNRFNPALFGRVAVILIAPIFTYINTEILPWTVNLGPVDVMTHATPLAMLQRGMELPGYTTMFLAFPGGAMSETSVVAVLAGGLYLLFKKHITWHIPFSIIGTVFVLTLISGSNPLYHLTTGGLMLGSFFMATDWVTSPITEKGKILFGISIGILIVIFRVVLAPTEGVAFSILIMNTFVPRLEKMTRRPSFSEPKPLNTISTAQNTISAKNSAKR